MHSVIRRFSKFRKLVRDVPARVTKFADPLLHQCVAPARIIFGLLHLMDQVSELSAAHLLRHFPRVSRFGFSQGTTEPTGSSHMLFDLMPTNVGRLVSE